MVSKCSVRLRRGKPMTDTLCFAASELKKKLVLVEERLDVFLQAESQGLLSFQSARQLDLVRENAEIEEDELRIALEQHIEQCSICR